MNCELIRRCGRGARTWVYCWGIVRTAVLTCGRSSVFQSTNIENKHSALYRVQWVPDKLNATKCSSEMSHVMNSSLWETQFAYLTLNCRTRPEALAVTMYTWKVTLTSHLCKPVSSYYGTCARSAVLSLFCFMYIYFLLLLIFFLCPLEFIICEACTMTYRHMDKGEVMVWPEVLVWTLSWLGAGDFFLTKTDGLSCCSTTHTSHPTCKTITRSLHNQQVWHQHAPRLFARVNSE